MIAANPETYLYADEKRKTLSDVILFGERVTAFSKTATDDIFVLTQQAMCGVVPGDSLAPVYATDEGEEYVVKSLFADVLCAPNFDAPPLFCLPFLSRVRVTGCVGDAYVRIALPRGGRGYVALKTLQKPLEDATPDTVCDAGLFLLDTPYRWGGRSPHGVDCSGLLSLAFAAHGKKIPRSTEQLASLPEVSLREARRGDLVLFSGHVGLLLTPERFVHASAETGRVGIASIHPADPLFDAPHVAGGFTVRRVLS